MLLSRYERMIARRYLLPGRSEAFIAVVAGFSLVAVMLGVAALIVVMSVMNGFRAELFDKITGLNGHAVVQGYAGQLRDWRQIVAQAKATPGVTSATPLIEQPLLVTFNGRVESAQVRGMRVEDIRANPALRGKEVIGSLNRLRPGGEQVAIGSRLAESLGATVGSKITVINFNGAATPMGTMYRSVSYTVEAIFEVGVYDFDKIFVVMPIEDAQTLLLLGDAVSMVEMDTNDPDNVQRIVSPLVDKVGKSGQIVDWRQMNRELFEALQVDRVVSFTVLSIILVVASFNIVSSLIMLVRSKMRDIAVLRTMGATRGGLMRIFVTVGTTIGALGVAAGGVLGFLFITFRAQVVQFIGLVTGQQVWDPSMRFLTELPAKTDPFETIGICVMALLFAFLATLYPAWKAASTDPVQVLRYE
ncbi:lipoprotein-releasing ABC transporter permease subunit [Sphingomonas psychrotolerans]|uniref:Lipoprotein-releasing system transmembrane subunit, LolC/LolE family n=1 Tax=Sphingomonas psychrotolerans TaxID=1327635 RepID=A0A2K8MEW1_9SPHN|nr:lipoprotein-releasing ABC transporter permease subunit [Sphingomonas psychrotolerans]ATY31504.1 lipoprotein-releasing system transmembrane subunit, LolC/LolE family [Sphingomonas psychrotolerans]